MPVQRSWFTCTQCSVRFERLPYKVRGRPFCSTACYRIAGPLRDSTVDRLWSRVCKTGCCWLWFGAQRRDGYGKLTVAKRYRLAHTVAYEVAYGSIPSDKIVTHTCDVKLCVRPDHLGLGTKATNSQDWHDRGRLGPGCCAAPMTWA